MDLLIQLVGIWIGCFVYIAEGVEGSDFGAACTGSGTGDCKEKTNTMCDTTCKCTADSFRKGSECAARIGPGATCAVHHCVTHAFCNTTSSLNKCQCNTGYTATPTGKPTMCSSNGVLKVITLPYTYVISILLSVMLVLR